MNFNEFGQLLKETREKKGLSVDDISLKLKISTKVIHAIEEDNIGKSIHGTYISAFIRTYGKFLELDPDAIKEFTSSINVENLSEHVPLSTNHGNFLGRHLKYYIVIILFLLLAIWGIWYIIKADIIPLSFKSSDLLTIVKPTPPQKQDAIKSEQPKSPTINTNVLTIDNLKIDTEANLEKIDSQNAMDSQNREKKNTLAKDNVKNNEEENAILLQEQKDNLKKATNAQILSNDKQENNVSSIDSDQKSSVISITTNQDNTLKETEKKNSDNIIEIENVDTNIAENVDTSIAENVVANTTTNDENNVNAPHRIIITALEECWIYSSADDTNTRQFTLLKGSTFALAFSKKLVLKFGNAGGVSIRYNGKDLPPVGKVGEVKTVTFPPEQE